MSQLHPREFAKLVLFYCQELVLDANTPGKEAKDRLIRNAQTLRDACTAWIGYCGWKEQDLMVEAWREQPNSQSEAKAKGKKK